MYKKPQEKKTGLRGKISEPGLGGGKENGRKMSEREGVSIRMPTRFQKLRLLKFLAFTPLGKTPTATGRVPTIHWYSLKNK